jgi:hypothetical protein
MQMEAAPTHVHQFSGWRVGAWGAPSQQEFNKDPYSAESGQRGQRNLDDAHGSLVILISPRSDEVNVTSHIPLTTFSRTRPPG